MFNKGAILSALSVRGASRIRCPRYTMPSVAWKKYKPSRE